MIRSTRLPPPPSTASEKAKASLPAAPPPSSLRPPITATSVWLHTSHRVRHRRDETHLTQASGSASHVQINGAIVEVHEREAFVCGDGATRKRCGRHGGPSCPVAAQFATHRYEASPGRGRGRLRRRGGQAVPVTVNNLALAELERLRGGRRRFARGERKRAVGCHRDARASWEC